MNKEYSFMHNCVVLLLLFLLPKVAYPQTYMIEAEQFQYAGGWKTEKDAEAFDKSLLMVTGGGVAADAVTVISVQEEGSYVFWSRTKDFKSQSPKTRISRLIVDDTDLSDQGKHGNDGLYWENVGTVKLTKGSHVLRLKDVAANYARVDAVLLTKDSKINPNNMSYKQLRGYILQPVIAKVDDHSLELKDKDYRVISESCKTVNEISNGAIRIKFLQSGNDLLNKTQVLVNNQWVSLNEQIEDNQIYLIKAKNSGVNFSSFYTSWTGVKPKELNVDGKKYPIYDIADMQNPFLSGGVYRLKAYSMEKVNDGCLKVYYATEDNDTVVSTWQIKKNHYHFDVTFEYITKQPQYYSIAMGALQEMNKESVSNVLLSPMYQFRRIPEKPNLLPMALCPQPVSIVEAKGMSCFITGNPIDFSRSWGAYDMGFSLLNINHKVQPMAFAPILGMKDSFYASGQMIRKTFKIGILPLQWHNTLQYVSDSIFCVKDYRTQTTSLNDAIYNIINLMKIDEASGWEADMKGFLDIESNPKVRTEVVQTSPLGLLSAAIITKDEDLYVKRALPAIEYMLSRKGYRWGYPNENDPETETMVNTFTPFKSEYNTAHFEALHKLLNYKNPWIVDVAMPNGSPRYSKGYAVNETWTGDLAAYKMTKDEKWLVKATIGADYMINNELYNNSSKPVYDWMFYNSHVYPQWFDLIDLYEVTKNRDYFNAACYGAFFTIAGQRSYPMVQNNEITIHKDGKYAGNANIFWKKDKRFKLGYPRRQGDVQEKIIDENVLSPVGLGFEQPMTFFTKGDNLNHVFMSSWAPSLLRLNANHKLDFFETYARNSIIGRFASYPGYYAAGYTDLPLDSIYPYKGPDVTSLYYHHIPSHLALTMDYLITEAIQRSKKVIDFPYGKQQGFVWFNNRIYGGLKGSILHDRNVELYMKKGLVELGAGNVNYVTGVSDENFWLVLLNEGNDPEKVDVKLNVPFVADNSEAEIYHFTETGSVVSDAVEMKNNSFTADIEPKGISLFSFPLAQACTHVDTKPVENGMREIDIAKNNKLYLFRIRSPFGWDSVYGYVAKALPKNYTVSMEYVADYSKTDRSARTQFPYEWTFVRIDNDKQVELKVVVMDGNKKVEEKSIKL